MIEKKSKKVKHRVLIVVLAIIAVLGIGAGITTAVDAPGRNEILNLAISDVDFKKLRDGVYTGKFAGSKGSTRNDAVEVTVVSGAVSKIRVIEGPLAGDKQTQAIRSGKTINDLFNSVIKAQSLKVDVISGATITSKAHLKAVENALEQAEIK